MSRQRYQWPQAMLVASEESAQNTRKAVCKHCGKNHFGECRLIIS